MERTTANGNVAGLYSEGNPTLGQPATTVSAKAMNDLQEEIINVIEDADGASLTLDGGSQVQLKLAIKKMIQNGGAATASSQSILNNQATPLDVTSMLFDKTLIKAARVLFDIHRKTDSANLNETGEIFVSHNTTTDSWDIAYQSNFDDAGVSFTITTNGQVKYTSSNIAGASYSGTLRTTHIHVVTQ